MTLEVERILLGGARRERWASQKCIVKEMSLTIARPWR
jgi:hypothetical protein